MTEKVSGRVGVGRRVRGVIGADGAAKELRGSCERGCQLRC